MDCCSSREVKEPKALQSKKSKAEERQKKLDELAAEKKSEIARTVKSVGNRFTNSKKFKDYVKKSFKEVDIDESNSLDANEVYIAVLLLYLKIAGTCKGAIPPDREDIVALMAKFDSPKCPGSLDYEHFEQFCQFLCSQIAGRVALQMFMQMALAPMLGLLAASQWEKLMLAYYPDVYKICVSYVPTDVVVTLCVGVGVSLFVPPLMNLVDYLILKTAKKHVKASAKTA